MAPDQRAALDSLMDFVQRVAMKIAELPENERRAAIQIARHSIAESAAEQGITDPELIRICTEGIDMVVSKIVESGHPSGGHA